MSAPVNRAEALVTVYAIARAAADAIMRVYAVGSVDVEYKGPKDPVTIADKQANAIICDALVLAYPGIPIVAEESDPQSFAGWASEPAAWFVDPLDGTREFIERNGEFAVMIGLAEQGRATLGVVLCPARGHEYVGAEGVGAFEVAKDGTHTPIRVSTVATLAEAELVVSRSRSRADLAIGAERLGVRKVTPRGSAGVKAMLVASGEADVYAHPGPAGKRWDSCAPEAIARAAGGVVSDDKGEPFEYASGEIENLRGFVISNPTLHPLVLELLRKGERP